MTSRRQFFQQGSLGLLGSMIFPFHALAADRSDFTGLVVNEDEGETYRLRDGTAIVKIKIAKTHSTQLSFLTERIKPGDFGPVHKHMNEDEVLFFHRGSGTFTMADKEYPVKEGSVVFVPKGVWHGWKNTGTEDIDLSFLYSPSGFEGFFREAGTAIDKPFVHKTFDERKAIAKKWGMIYKE